MRSAEHNLQSLWSAERGVRNAEPFARGSLGVVWHSALPVPHSNAPLISALRTDESGEGRRRVVRFFWDSAFRSLHSALK